MKKFLLVLPILLIFGTGCSSKKETEYDPFGSSAVEKAKELNNAKASSDSSSAKSQNREFFLEIPEEVEAGADKKVAIHGKTLPNAEVSIYIKSKASSSIANELGEFTIREDFISISDQEYTVSAKLGDQYTSKKLTIRTNSKYEKELKRKAEELNKERENIPTDFISALNKGISYSETLHLSKAGIYDQLTSELGEKFSPEAAQYAVDNMKVDWNKNALAKAKSYQEKMSMSPDAIRDQLISDHGEKFSPEEAEYAIQNLNQ
ncbi:Ltp family lipoprotein [Enterococcus sp. AZ126]|uniref:Ltp family lipoprotein n=1 Tax=Enterococcus sp. AZ126 TaxID=2774635 RepID=UPI003F29B47C